MRLTKSNREKLLKLNEGFETSTYYESRNSREQRTYKIKEGKLQVRRQGKTSWADSRYDKTEIADEEDTHRFLYRFLGMLKKE